MLNMTPFPLRMSLLLCFVCCSLLASLLLAIPDRSFAEVQTSNSSDDQVHQSLTPQLLYNNTWKISTVDGPADWSPTEDLLVVSSWAKSEPSAILLYGANGTKLMTIAEFEQGAFISSALFSPNGSKIAYTHTMSPDSSSQLQIFDLKTRATQNFQFQGNFTYFDWMPDGNHVIYLMSRPSLTEGDLPAYELRVHDLRTGSETVIDPVTNVNYFDLSQDGTTLILVRQVINQQPCGPSIDGNCYADEIVILKLGQNNRDSNLSGPPDEQTDNGWRIISSEAIWRSVSGPNGILFPRWVLNDSAIIFSIGHVRCYGPIIAISPDGTRNQTFFAAPDGGTIDGACHESGGVFNRDGTILAHTKGTGICAAYCSFNPVDTGLYLTYTELCATNECTPPSRTIPMVKGQVMSSFGVSTVYGNPSDNGYVNVGYQEKGESVLDEKTKTLSVRFQTPQASELIGERDVLLYLPSSLINGDMVVFLNGTQFHPPLVQNADCPDNWSDECDKIAVSIDKIEGWSIVNIKDDTTAPRSAVSLEITGTTATPEFGSLIVVFAVAVAALIGAAFAGNWERSLKLK